MLFLLKLGSFTFKVYYFLVFVSDTNEGREEWGETGGDEMLHKVYIRSVGVFFKFKGII